MTTTIKDYIDVRLRVAELGGIYPSTFSLLPSNFADAGSVAELRQVSEAATVKTLLRKANIPQQDIFSPEQRPPYIQNNSFEWVAPTLFIAAALLSENPHAVSVALGVISEYAADVIRGFGARNKVELRIVVEQAKSKTFKEISYKGPPEGLKELDAIIRATAEDE